MVEDRIHGKITYNVQSKIHITSRRRSDLMVSALNSGASAPGSSPDGYCPLKVLLSTQMYGWVMANYTAGG